MVSRHRVGDAGGCEMGQQREEFCLACKRETPHIQVVGAGGRKTFECKHCLEVGDPRPVEPFSKAWAELTAEFAAA